MVQEVEHEAMSSNTKTTKKRQRKVYEDATLSNSLEVSKQN
jgi:hypothetical protein